MGGSCRRWRTIGGIGAGGRAFAGLYKPLPWERLEQSDLSPIGLKVRKGRQMLEIEIPTTINEADPKGQYTTEVLRLLDFTLLCQKCWGSKGVVRVEGNVTVARCLGCGALSGINGKGKD